MRFGHTSLEFSRVANQIVSGGVPDFSKFNVVDHVRNSLSIEHISVVEITAEIHYIVPNALSDHAIKGLIDLKTRWVMPIQFTSPSGRLNWRPSTSPYGREGSSL